MNVFCKSLEEHGAQQSCRHTSLLEAECMHPSPSQALPAWMLMCREQQDCFGGVREGQEGPMLGYSSRCPFRAVLLCVLMWWTNWTGVIHVPGCVKLFDKQAVQKLQ